MVDHFARLVEAVRRERPKDVKDDLADTIMWLFSMIAQMQQSNDSVDKPFSISRMPSEMIWNKCPDCCPACLDFNFAEIVEKAGPNEEPLSAIMKADDAIKAMVEKEGLSASGSIACQCLSRISFAETRHQEYNHISMYVNIYRNRYRNATRYIGKKKEIMREVERMFYWPS